MARITITSPGSEDRVVQLDGTSFTAGTAPEGDIVLADSHLVSARHASIRFENNRWFVRDERSVYGTYVNQRRVKEQGLRDGDVLELGLGGPVLRFEAEAEERERNSATTAGHLKQLYEQQHAEEPTPEPLEGAGKLAIPPAARGLLYAMGGIAIVALGLFWMGERDAEPDPAGLAEASSPLRPGGPLYPLQTASRVYQGDQSRVASEAERHRDGGIRRQRMQEELAGLVAGIEGASDDPVSLDSLQAAREAVELRLDAFERLQEIGRDAATSLVLIQTGFQVDSFYFPGPIGTGFFVGGDGRLVTSRHLVAPDSYIRSTDEVGLACALQELESRGTPARRVVSIWAPGSVPGERPEGGLDPATATHSTEDGSLEVVRLLGGDAAEPRLIGCPEGGVVESHHDASRVADLALLSVPGGDFPALLLANQAPAAGEMVLLTGFPRGTMENAGGDVPWMSFAPVTSTGESILFGVPVLPGTDGGPLLDDRGRLVGVATSSRNDEGMAIGVTHVRSLLGGS